MIVSKNSFPILKKVLFAATAVFALTQCSEEEVVNPSRANTSVQATSASTTAASLTVTGSNTAYATLTDCKTCTYIVSAKEELIDGKALGLKPGNIICLNKGIQYGNLEFVNIEGTAEKPVIIATVKDANSDIIVAQASSEQDPY